MYNRLNFELLTDKYIFLNHFCNLLSLLLKLYEKIKIILLFVFLKVDMTSCLSMLHSFLFQFQLYV